MSVDTLIISLIEFGLIGLLIWTVMLAPFWEYGHDSLSKFEHYDEPTFIVTTTTTTETKPD